MASKRKSRTSDDDAEWLPSKRICDNLRANPRLFESWISAKIQATSSKRNKNDKKFPFNKLSPELRNKIYELVIDKYFDKTQRLGHRLDKQLSYNAIPYTISDSLNPHYKHPINGYSGKRSHKLPSFERFLASGNQQLHQEFASIRIARSELWLSPGVLPRDGVRPTFSHIGRQIAAMDKQHTEQITYSIIEHKFPGDFARSNNACQGRLFALGPALKDLASDTMLPNLSRVTIYLEQYFFFANNITTFARYQWEPVFEGLRFLLKSGKLERFELRMSDPGRATVRTKEIQEAISKMVGKTAVVEGRGCNECLPYEKGVSGFQDTDFSLVWKAEKGGSLSVKDPGEGVEILDVKTCQKCGKFACERFVDWEEEEEFVYQ